MTDKKPRRIFRKLTALFLGIFLALIIIVMADGLFHLKKEHRSISTPGFHFVNKAPNNLQPDSEHVFEQHAKPSMPENPPSHGYMHEYQSDFISNDYTLGYLPYPNFETRHRFSADGRVIYDAKYAFDSYSRRITPQEFDDPPNKHALFFGGSFTFGQGVENNQTLPARTMEKLPGYRGYNYGFMGYGPNHMLARLQSYSFPNEVSEPEGFAVYTFYEDHPRRAILPMQMIAKDPDKRPYYFIDENGELTRRGYFSAVRPYTFALYRILSHSAIFQHFQIDLPPRPTEKHLELVVRIIEEADRAYRARFPKGNFYVLIYPGSGSILPYCEKLAKKGITCLDYSNLLESESSKYLFEFDNHPTALAYDEVSKKLSEDLKEMGW